MGVVVSGDDWGRARVDMRENQLPRADEMLEREERGERDKIQESQESSDKRRESVKSQFKRGRLHSLRSFARSFRHAGISCGLEINSQVGPLPGSGLAGGVVPEAVVRQRVIRSNPLSPTI